MNIKRFYSIPTMSYDPDDVKDLFIGDYGLTEAKSPKDADIIIWNGGADISPSIYGATPIPGSGPPHTSTRDDREIALFEEFPDTFKLGICRGSQLLNCLNGGKLYQHVDGHGGSHPMIDLTTGEVLMVTSTHHQMMIPNYKDGEVIGRASRSKVKYTDQGEHKINPTADLKMGHDVEIVWYPKTHTLCIQGHPEYVPGSRFAEYTWELINKCKGA